MQNSKKYYPMLFWDYPELQKLAHQMSVQQFKDYIYKIKKDNYVLFESILRRFIERGHITEGIKVFDIEDIEMALKKISIWQKLSKLRLNAWEHAIAFIRKYELNRISERLSNTCSA
jgi:hypothetical protein